MSGGGQFLTLRLGTEDYAIEILRVQEIRSYEAPKRTVNAPAFEATIGTRFIIGLATLGDRLLSVMNIEALMSNAGLGM